MNFIKRRGVLINGKSSSSPSDSPLELVTLNFLCLDAKG
jgi:hypothetical protein